MFGLRRYRVFLLIAAISALSIYWLSNRGSWDIADLERLGQTAINHGTPTQPKPEDPVPERPLPPPPKADVSKPAAPPKAEVTSRTVSSSTSTSTTTTTSKKPPAPTLKHEDPLSNVPVLDSEFGQEGSGRWEADSVPMADGKRARWQKPKAHFPIPEQKIMRLPSGTPKKLPKIQAASKKESTAARRERITKLNTIKESFKHAWSGYKKHGLPHDEVQPLSKGYKDPFMGWGATLVDTLDTLWIMGLKQEFEDAVKEVEKIDFATSDRKDIPLFETVIRYLGGLIAAYDVSNAKYGVLLQKAEELAEILMGAFDTPNRMPMTFYNWAPSYTSQQHRAPTHAVMAELGSLSVEMTRLAQITGKHEYYDAVARITDELEKWQPNTLMPGLWPLKVDASGCKKIARDEVDDDLGKPVLVSDDVDFDIIDAEPAVYPAPEQPKDPKGPRGGKIKRGAPAGLPPGVKEFGYGNRSPPLSKVEQEILAVDCTPQGLAAPPNAKVQTYGIGGQADSTYEYLPKMHALLQGRSQQYETMYRESAKAIRESLLFRPMIQEEGREILFAAKHNLKQKARDAKRTDDVVYEVTHLSCFVGGMFGLGAKLFGIESDLELAKQLTDGCVWAYESMPTSIMAESAALVPCPDMDVCPWDEKKWHDALDPDQEERFAAVDAWNKKQKAIYEKSQKEALAAAAVDNKEEVPAARPTADAVNGEAKRARRAASDEEPSRTSPRLAVEDDEDSNASEEGSPIRFVPKTALSHEKYVKARILEERLPPSYTRIFDRHYGLRPEAIESVFYMYRLTGDDIWRQKGWKMFEAVQSATQTEVANAAIKDVTSHIGELDDVMESFWLAETLKYFYLLFDEPDHISLDKWVLNTEAHPFSLAGGALR